MKLNEKLNFVIPIYGNDDVITAYVHSTPISREVFEAHFLIISRVFAAIHAEGLGEIAGPRVAALVMKKVAERMNDPESAESLLNEIRRLSNAVVRNPGGWIKMPLQDAIDGKHIDDEDAAEVLNALVFFTATSAMHRRQVAREVLNGAARLWGAQISSLDFTAFVASLKTSTEAVSIGVIPTPASSVPY